jgi:hypothetical protein
MPIEIFPDSIHIICAKRGYGKSIMANYLLYHLVKNKLIDILYIFSNTPEDYGMSDSSHMFTNGFDEEIANRIIRYQTEQKKKVGKANLKHIMLLLDDIENSTSDARQSKALNTIALRGRHLNIGCIVSTQYYTQIHPKVRNNCDYLFIGRNGSVQLSDMFKLQTIFENETQFRSYVNRTTTEHRFVLLNNKTDDRNPKVIKAKRLNLQFKMKK